MTSRRLHRHVATAIAATLGFVSACSPGRPLEDGGTAFYDGGVLPRADNGNTTPTPGRDTGLPPEREERRTFGEPQAGGRFVFIANPRRNNVAAVDSTTLSVRTIEAGASPSFLRAIPGRDEAVVLNAESDNVTVIRATERTADTSFVRVARDANALAVAPDGRHAIAFFDSDAPDVDPASGSFQDISVLTLAPGADEGVDLSVGFRPLEVTFTADGATAFVITEDGISILRFASIRGPAIVPSISLGESTTTRDVQVTRDGRYAIARREGSHSLVLANFTDRTLADLDLAAAVTDADIAPSGEYALAVVREQSAVLRIPIPGGFSDPAQIRRIDLPGETVGSVTISPDGRHALLFTTAAAVERVSVIDLVGADDPYSVRLRKPVRAIAIAPDGLTALIIHSRINADPNAPGIDLETRIDRSYGYSLMDLATGFVKLQLSDADVGPLAITPDGSYAFVTIRDDAHGIRQVHRDSLRSFVVEPLPLGSPPLSVGIVPGTQRAFIGQDHPEGRITFVDWNTGALQSVTGFELNSRIVM